LHGEINEQMRALDDMMREMEDVVADHLQDRGAEQGGRLCEKWMRVRTERAAALKSLDQRTMTGTKPSLDQRAMTGDDWLAFQLLHQCRGSST
jgi:hypothetical protein